MEGKILKTQENRLLYNSASGKLLKKPDKNYFRLTFVGEGEGTINVLSTSFMRVSLNGEPWVGEKDINNYYSKVFNVKKGDVLYFWTRSVQRSVYGPYNSQYGSYIGNNSSKYFYDDTNAIDYEVSGNIMSLLYPDFEGKDVLPNRSQCSMTGLKAGFGELFYNCTHLVSAYNLEIPIKTWVTDYNDIGCRYMFRGCSNMKYGPKELPATTLFSYCYYGMFMECTNMKYGPKELPTLTVNEYAYSYMFSYCKKLKDSPYIKAIESKEAGCYNMFYDCNNLTNVQKVLHIETAQSSGLRGMFFRCKKIITAPEILLTIINSSAISGIFQSCSSINYIKVHFTSWDGFNWSYWASGVASKGTFVKPEALPTQYGSNYIPTGWTVVSEASL